jgi:hypothetical protein
MLKNYKNILNGAILATSLLFFTGCGDDNQPKLSDAVKGSFTITNGMSMDEVNKLMKIEPTDREKIGDIVIYRYEGNTQSGEDETLKITYNNVIVKFKDGKVINSGTFSCNVPQVNTED